MSKFLFYIEGLGREVWISASSEKDARAKLWNGLSIYEQNAVVQFECIDVAHEEN